MKKIKHLFEIPETKVQVRVTVDDWLVVHYQFMAGGEEWHDFFEFKDFSEMDVVSLSEIVKKSFSQAMARKMAEYEK